jgi:GH25 family lysozyme M1 (1,4-beta-N-acetylmuramidase)
MVGVIDSSGWQFNYKGSGKLNPGAASPNFQGAVGQGVVGIIHRIGNGTSLDQSFTRTYHAAKTAGLKIGAYYYGQPGRMTAQAAVDTTQFMLNGYDLDLPVMLDLEAYYGDTLSKNNLAAWVNHYLVGMSEKGQHPAILYAGAAFANTNTIGDVSTWDTIQPRYYKYGVRPLSSVESWPGFINWDRQPRYTSVLGDWEGYQFTSDLFAPDFGFPRDAATDRLDGNLVRKATWDSWQRNVTPPPPPPPPPAPPVETGEYEMKLVTPRRAKDERQTQGGPLKLHKAQVVPSGSPVKVVQVSIAVTGHADSGYLSDRVGTSFHNYTANLTSNVVLDMPVQPDGTIIFGSLTDVYCVVDVRGEGQ